MDLFTKNRTFLVTFVLLLLFVFFLLKYFTTMSESFTINLSPYEKQYIQIDNAEEPRIHETPALFSNRVTGKAECHSKCHKQPECQSEDMECVPEYSNGLCHCPFQPANGIKEGFNVFEQARQLCKETQICSAWEAHSDETWNTTSWTPLIRRPNVVRWKDLKVSNINRMSISFWVYFDETLAKKNPYTSIFQIAKSSYNGSQNWQNNDAYLGIFATAEEPSLNVRTITDQTYIETNVEPVLIGYSAVPSHIVLTINDGQWKIYKNGRWELSGGKNPIMPPDDDAKVMSGITYDPYNVPPQGISVKDVRVYNHVLSEHNIPILYNKIERAGTKESFQSMVQSMSEPMSQGNYRKQSWMDTMGNVIRTNLFFVDQYKAKEVDGFQSGPAPPSGPKIDMSHLVLRSSTNHRCNRSKGASVRANNQHSPNHNKPVIHRAIVHFPNQQSLEFTRDIQNALNQIDTDPNAKVLVNQTELTGSVRIEFEIIHSLTREKQSFEVTYNNYQTVSWKTIVDRVKCINSDDMKWDSSKETCNFVGQALTCGGNAPDCMHYTAGSSGRLGNCSAANPLVYKTEKVRIENGRTKTVKYVALSESEEGVLDMKVDEALEKSVMFGENGTTISMWFRIPPPQYSAISSSMHCFLLGLGNRNGTFLEDPVFISVDSKGSLHFIAYDDKQREVRTMDSYVLDEQWHHIAWVLDKTNAQWRFYHNGNPIDQIETSMYPSAMPRQTKMVGTSGMNTRVFHEPDIADFRMYGKVLDNTLIKNIYLENSVA